MIPVDIIYTDAGDDTSVTSVFAVHPSYAYGESDQVSEHVDTRGLGYRHVRRPYESRARDMETLTFGHPNGGTPQ